ncbi:MAG: 4-hydroxy-tetrahydrodipicolinate synthase [Clostridiaceae bacterium]|nr:4-hydroxy-tetrahydrodipicolinate synthase [Clostridiaceae bacterium]
MKKPVFTGSAVAIVTPFFDEPKLPFTATGGVNYDALGLLIDDQIARGTDAIVICGTTGESPVLNDAEHKKCIEFTVEHVARRVPVIAGTGSNDTAYAVSLTKHAAEAGADAVLMVTPYYNKTTQKGLIKHYMTVADAAEIPIILYNVPSRTGMGFTAETYLALSKHPNINGVKEASGDFSLVAATKHLCGDEMNIWSGNDDQTLPLLSLGGCGVISTTANVAPEVMHGICAKFFEGDIAAARKLQLDWYDLMHNLFIETNPIPVKTAMQLLKYPVGGLRLPLCEMNDANHARLVACMQSHGMI